MKKALAVTFCVNTAIDKAIDKGMDKSVDETVKANEKNKKIIDVEEFSNKFSDNSFSTSLQQIILKPSRDGEDEIDKMRKSLKELFKKAYKDDEMVKEIMDAKARSLQKLPKALIKKDIVLSMGDLKIKSKRLYVKNRMYVPENEPLQLFLLLQQHHNPPIHGHPRYKTLY